MRLSLLKWGMVLLLMNFAWADPTGARKITQSNSKCVVQATAGEYPLYTVFQKGRVIYSPQSDGVLQVQFSPSGRYVALSAGETSLLDLEKDKFEYGVVLVNCETGKRKGYRKGLPTLLKGWEGERRLRIDEILEFTAASGLELP